MCPCLVPEAIQRIFNEETPYTVMFWRIVKVLSVAEHTELQSLFAIFGTRRGGLLHRNKGGIWHDVNSPLLQGLKPKSFQQGCFRRRKQAKVMLLRMGSPGHPPRLSHSSWPRICVFFLFFKCCFMSTQTVQTIRDIIWRPPELWVLAVQPAIWWLECLTLTSWLTPQLHGGRGRLRVPIGTVNFLPVLTRCLQRFQMPCSIVYLAISAFIFPCGHCWCTVWNTFGGSSSSLVG